MEQVELALQRAVKDIDYENFKDSVEDHELHLAYMRTWTAMSELQHPKSVQHRLHRQALISVAILIILI